LERALALWRGPALAEFRGEPLARDAGGRLEEARLATIEERIAADLALGRHARLVPELEHLISREPYRERLRGQLMLALYRSDRQAEALEVYRRTRETLSDELGIEPSEALQELERAILRQDRGLKVGRQLPRADEAAPAESRRSRRRRLLLPVGVVLALAVAAVAATLALTGGSRGNDASSNRTSELRTFVTKIENFLDQSRDGRRDVAAAVGGAVSCSLTPHAALVRLNRVQRNRQSLLQQVAALSVPTTEEALRASDLLQQAVLASINADWHYRDWLQTRTRCGRPANSSDFRAAQTADVKATRAKQSFVAAFDPLARRFGKRVWAAGEF
jgi:hypothetical protein